MALSGDVIDSSGTYSYSKNSEYTGTITFNDSLAGQGLTSQMSFDTSTTGTLFLRKLGSTGYQTGVFSMTTPTAVPPSIIDHPASQTIIAGGNVTFSVTVEGSEPFTFQWRKDGVNIDGATQASYAISDVQVSHEGEYDVVVSNSAGSITSSAATLVVIEPPDIVTHPSNQKATVGSSASFTVTATGSAPLSYQWLKNGEQIPDANLSSYSISNVQASDAGSYTVRVSNPAGSINSDSAILEVILVADQPPALRNPAWSPTAGFTAILEGQAQTSYTVQWSTNGKDWNALTNFVAEEVATQIRDPEAATIKTRFYRAMSP